MEIEREARERLERERAENERREQERIESERAAAAPIQNQPVQVQNVAQNVANNNNHRNGIFLETIKLDKFSGDYSKWMEWKAMFDSYVHNNNTYDNTQKISYLKQALEGSALQSLDLWSKIGQNYLPAYNHLEKLYENNYRITMAYLDDLFSMPKFTIENYTNLRSMIDTIGRVTSQLATAKLPVKEWDAIFIYMLITKMPPRTKIEWETNHNLNQLPKLEQVLEFLDRRSRGQLNVMQSSSQPNQ